MVAVDSCNLIFDSKYRNIISPFVALDDPVVTIITVDNSKTLDYHSGKRSSIQIFAIFRVVIATLSLNDNIMSIPANT